MKPADLPQAQATLADPRWAAVLARDPAADGRFYYAVSTTGVYCRPSCGARRPRPENVSFHGSREAAEAAGFRPCRRCHPERDDAASTAAARVTAACRLIDAAEQPPALDALAAAAGLSPHHFHRLFKRITGLTPRAYATARRAERLRAALAGGAPVTDAIYHAGYGAGSRCYSETDAVLGMSPGRYRAGGTGAEIRFAVGQCTLGAVLVAASTRGVCAILLGDDPDALVRDLQDRFPRATLIGGDGDFEATVALAVGLVEAPALGLALPLDIQGTAFQQRVWLALREIPPGRTASYAEIAQRIGSPAAVRAVAGACAANPIAIAIPCHRVVRSDGALSGYRWGVARKRELLAREAAAQAGCA